MGNGDSGKKPSARFQVVEDTMVPVKSFNLGASQPRMKTAKAVKPVSAKLMAQPIFKMPVVNIDEEPESLPVVPSDEEVESGDLFKDRNNDKLRWHIPGYTLSVPSDNKLFLCHVEDKMTSREGKTIKLYQGRLSVGFEVLDVVPEDKRKRLEGEHPNISFKKAPVELKESVLRFNYYDQVKDREVTEEILGAFNPQDKLIHFDLKDDYLKVIYQNIARANAEGDQEKDSSFATLIFRGAFDGWRKPNDLPQDWILPNITLDKVFTPQPKIRPQTVDNINMGAVPNLKGRNKSDKADDKSPKREPSGNNADGKPLNIRSSGIAKKVPLTAVNTLKAQKINQAADKRKQKNNNSSDSSEGSTQQQEGKESSKLVRQEFQIEKNIPIKFSCKDNRRHFALEKENSTITFGCTPPWSEVSGSLSRYEPLDLEGIKEATVLESRAEPNTYLLIPNKYVITRDHENGFPAVAILEAVNPEKPNESMIRFQFAVEPSFNSYEWGLIRQKLLTLTTRKNGNPSSPKIFLPHEVPGINTKVSWKSEMGAKVSHSPIGKGYEFILIFDSLKNAKLATETLKGGGSSLLGRLDFEISSSNDYSSTLDFDINETTGPVLKTKLLDSKTVKVTNTCESPVILERLLLFTKGEIGYKSVKLSAPKNLDPNSSIKLKNELPDEDFDSVAIDYTIDEQVENVFSDRMVELDLLVTNIAVTTNLNAGSRKIKEFRVEVKYPAADQREKCILTPSEGSFANSNAILQFNPPLGTIISSSERSVNYQVTIEYQGDKEKFVSEWIQQDIGRSKLLNISASDIGLNNSNA